MKNCSTCYRFLNCRDRKKGESGYYCNDWKLISDNQAENFLALARPLLDRSSPVPSPVSENSERKDEADFQTVLRNAMSPENAIPPDLKIDDRDIPQAPNFYEFCMSSSGLNQPPFPRQLWIFTHLLGEYCPRCTNMNIWENVLDFPVDYNVKEAKQDICFLEYGKCPECGHTKSEFFNGVENRFLQNYMSAALCIGQRSGKSIGSSLVISYLIHSYIKLQDPTRVYELTRNTTLSATFVAMTFSRAKSLIYEPVSNIILDSPWFQEYGELMRHYENKYSEEIFDIGKEFMRFRHRNLFVYPASPMKRVLRGDDRFLSVIDELGWFPFGEDSNDRERASANEVYEALDRSMLTIRDAFDKRVKEGFNNIPNAFGIYASSPSANNDKIMSLVRTFENSDLALGVHLPTWEMNPKIKRNSRAIQQAYMDNHVKAERDYGANPPLSDAAFIGDVSEIIESFTKKPNLIGKYKYTTVSRGSRTRRSAKFSGKIKSPGFPTLLCLDAGHSSNSFGLSVGGINSRNRVYVLGCMEIAPSHTRSLDHGMIYRNIIIPIIREMNVVKVITDRWQSIKLLQDIEHDMQKENRVMETAEYSLKRDDFDFVLDYMMDRDVAPHMPRLEMDFEDICNTATDNYPHCFKYKPVSHLLFQMTTVRETSKTIDKGQGYTDDIFRSLFLLLAHLYDEEDAEWLKKQRVKTVTTRGGLISSSLSTNSYRNSQTSKIGSSGKNHVSTSPRLKIGR